MTDYSYLGSGKLSVRVAGSAAPLLEVGNCSALAFSINEDVKELKDYTQAGGGTYNEVRRISSVEMSMTAHDFSPENLARALYGSTSAVVGAAVTGETATFYKGGLIAFAKVPTSAARTVKASNGVSATTRANSAAVSLGAYIVPAVANGYYYKVTTAGTTAAAPPTFTTTVGGTITDGTATLTVMGKVTLVQDTDYTNTTSGVRIATAGAVTDGEPASIDYTSASGNVVEALTSSAQEYELVFEGLNEARSGKAVVVSIYRGKLGAAAQLPFIGDDFGALEVTGKVLKDSSKTGAGVSQYFKVALVA